MGIDVNAIEQTVVVTAVGDEVNVNIIDQPVLVSVTDQIIEVNASGGTGPQGPGVAIGGTTGQVLIKASNTNYDTTWVDAGLSTSGVIDIIVGAVGSPIPANTNVYSNILIGGKTIIVFLDNIAVQLNGSGLTYTFNSTTGTITFSDLLNLNQVLTIIYL